MTVSSTASSATFIGNNSTTAFNFSFNSGVPTGQTTSEASFTVIYTSPTGVETTLAPSTYSIAFTPAAAGSLWSNGGVLTYPLTGSPIASGSTLTLIRTFPLTQTTTISNQGDFAPQVIEEMGDTLAMQIQQINNRTTQWRGTWMSGVVYNPGDIVQDGSFGAATNNYYLCAIGNTSGTWATDLGAGDWTLSVQAILPTSNQPITLSGAVTGTGSQAITTSFGTVAASSFSGNAATATAVPTAIALSTSTLAGRGASASGGAAAIALGSGLSMSGTTVSNSGVVTVKAQTFTSSATYTPSAGMIYCNIKMVAGGGGGGGNGAGTGGAGGAGGYIEALLTAAQIGSSIAVIVGAAGSGGSGANGSTGTSTSVSSLLSCTGGAGGVGTTGTLATGGAGGTATASVTTILVNIPGQRGGNTSVGSNFANGSGGSNPLGWGGASTSIVSGSQAGFVGTGYGSGGSGGNNAAGGNGAPGIVIITEYCSQ